MTLRSTDPDGQTGITGLRTFVGVEREFGRYEVSLGYLRQQDMRYRAPDRIGHAPFIGGRGRLLKTGRPQTGHPDRRIESRAAQGPATQTLQPFRTAPGRSFKNPSNSRFTSSGRSCWIQ